MRTTLVIKAFLLGDDLNLHGFPLDMHSVLWMYLHFSGEQVCSFC